MFAWIIPVSYLINIMRQNGMVNNENGGHEIESSVPLPKARPTPVAQAPPPKTLRAAGTRNESGDRAAWLVACVAAPLAVYAGLVGWDVKNVLRR